MEGSLAILGFWLFMIVLVLKKPITNLIEKVKPASDKQAESKMQNLEVILHAMAKDIGEIRQLLQAQNAGTDLLQLKSALKEIEDSSEENKSETSETDGPDVSHVGSTHGGEDDVPDDSENSNIELVVSHSHPSSDSADDVEYLDDGDNLGVVVDASTIRFERILSGTVEQVWQYISEPQLLKQWLCSSAKFTPRENSRVEYEFQQNGVADFIGCSRIRGLVRDVSANYRLGHSWIDSTSAFDSEVSYEIEKYDDNETKLIVTHSRVPSNKMAEYLSSWHIWLDNLLRRLRGAVPFDFASTSKLLLPVYSAIVLASAISGTPAQARLSDQDYQTVKAERDFLLDKFDAHWHRADVLEREISDLKRDNTAASDDRANQLSKSLDDEHRDLRKIELDIRDLDKVLI